MFVELEHEMKVFSLKSQEIMDGQTNKSIWTI